MFSFSLFAVVKVLVSILVVVLLSLIAERAGPRVAGIASGYPLGAAISLFLSGSKSVLLLPPGGPSIPPRVCPPRWLLSEAIC